MSWTFEGGTLTISGEGASYRLSEVPPLQPPAQPDPDRRMTLTYTPLSGVQKPPKGALINSLGVDLRVVDVTDHDDGSFTLDVVTV